MTATIKYDATAPTAIRRAGARPGQNGWYNHAVTFDLTGTDATSGIDSCGGGYSGPDGTSRQAQGTCTDVAGNAERGRDRDDQLRLDEADGDGGRGSSAERERLVQRRR